MSSPPPAIVISRAGVEPKAWAVTVVPIGTVVAVVSIVTTWAVVIAAVVPSAPIMRLLHRGGVADRGANAAADRARRCGLGRHAQQSGAKQRCRGAKPISVSHGSFSFCLASAMA